MRCYARRKGSILLISLIMLSVILVLADRLIRNVNVHSRYVTVTELKRRAKFFALGGVTLALAQLKSAIEGDEKKEKVGIDKSINNQDKKVQGSSDGKLSNEQLQRLYGKLLPHLNRWQIFELNRKIDGVDGTIKFCISSEDGKIPINHAYDFENDKFKDGYESIIKKSLLASNSSDDKDRKFHEKIAKFLKKRAEKLDDVSELCEIREFNLFYNPPETLKKGVSMALRPKGWLYDFFTVWSEQDGINPLLLSDSMCVALGLRRPLAGDAKRKKETFKTISKKIDREYAKDFEKHFNDIASLYSDKTSKDVVAVGGKSDGLAKLKGLLSKEIEPQVFSVLSCGLVDNVEQRVLAVVKRTQIKVDAKKDDVKSSSFMVPLGFEVIRFFWL